MALFFVWAVFTCATAVAGYKANIDIMLMYQQDEISLGSFEGFFIDPSSSDVGESRADLSSISSKIEHGISEGILAAFIPCRNDKALLCGYIKFKLRNFDAAFPSGGGSLSFTVKEAQPAFLRSGVRFVRNQNVTTCETGTCTPEQVIGIQVPKDNLERDGLEINITGGTYSVYCKKS